MRLSLQKVRFLKDYDTFKKDSYRVILGEDSEYYHIQENLHGLDQFRLAKKENGSLYQVVERS